MAKKSRRNGKARPRRMNGVAVAMRKRFSVTTNKMVKRNKKRAKDARNNPVQKSIDENG